MSHREPLCWRRGTVPVPYVDALAARRSTSHRLSLASKKKILRFLPPVSSLVFFPFSLNAKTFSHIRLQLRPPCRAHPPGSAKGNFRLSEMFSSSVCLLMSLCSCDGETADPSDFSDRQLSLPLCNLMPHEIFVTSNRHYPFLFLMGLKSGDLVHKSPHVFVPSYFKLS